MFDEAMYGMGTKIGNCISPALKKLSKTVFAVLKNPLDKELNL
jgi:hypothetical protein